MQRHTMKETVNMKPATEISEILMSSEHVLGENKVLISI